MKQMEMIKETMRKFKNNNVIDESTNYWLRDTKFLYKCIINYWSIAGEVP